MAKIKDYFGAINVWIAPETSLNTETGFLTAAVLPIVIFAVIYPAHTVRSLSGVRATDDCTFVHGVRALELGFMRDLFRRKVKVSFFWKCRRQLLLRTFGNTNTKSHWSLHGTLTRHTSEMWDVSPDGQQCASVPSREVYSM
jgi:hypothetical protein